MYTPLCLVLLCYTILFTQLNSIPIDTAHTPERIMQKVETMKERTLLMGLGVTTVMLTPVKNLLPLVFKHLSNRQVLKLPNFVRCFQFLIRKN